MEIVVDVLLVILLLVSTASMIYFLISAIKSDIELKKVKKELEANRKKFEEELEIIVKVEKEKAEKNKTTKRKVGRPKKEGKKNEIKK